VTQAFAVNDRGAQMQPEYGGTVVATARVMAPDVAAMIPQTTPQRTSTCFGEPVRTDPDDTVTSIPPELAALVEEVDAVGWSTGIGGAVPQESRAAHVLCKVVKERVELIRVGLAVSRLAAPSYISDIRILGQWGGRGIRARCWRGHRGDRELVASRADC
jgi:hypothetical protein